MQLAQWDGNPAIVLLLLARIDCSSAVPQGVQQLSCVLLSWRLPSLWALLSVEEQSEVKGHILAQMSSHTSSPVLHTLAELAQTVAQSCAARDTEWPELHTLSLTLTGHQSEDHRRLGFNLATSLLDSLGGRVLPIYPHLLELVKRAVLHDPSVQVRTASLQTLCTLLESDFLGDESLAANSTEQAHQGLLPGTINSSGSWHSGKTFLSQLMELATTIGEAANMAHNHCPPPQDLLCALISGVRALSACVVRPYHQDHNTAAAVLRLGLRVAITTSHTAEVRCQAWQVVEAMVALHEDDEDLAFDNIAPCAAINLDTFIQGTVHAARELDAEEDEEEGEVAAAALSALSALAGAEIEHEGRELGTMALQLCAEGLQNGGILPMATCTGLTRCVTALGEHGENITEVSSLFMLAMSRSTQGTAAEGAVCKRAAAEGLSTLAEHWSELEHLGTGVLLQALQHAQPGDVESQRLLFEVFNSLLRWGVNNDIAAHLPDLCATLVHALRGSDAAAASAASLCGSLALRLPATAMQGHLRGLAEALAPCIEPPQGANLSAEISEALQSVALESIGVVLVSAAGTGELQAGACRAIVQCALRGVNSTQSAVRAAVFRCCQTILSELGEVALSFVPVSQLVQAVVPAATVSDGSEVVLRGGYGVHTADMEVRVAALQALSACVIAGHTVAAACFQALLSNIAGIKPHPNVEVQREACLGLQPWWQWFVSPAASGAQQELEWVVEALIRGIEAVVSCQEGGAALEAAGLAGMILDCDAVKAHQASRERLERAAAVALGGLGGQSRAVGSTRNLARSTVLPAALAHSAHARPRQPARPCRISRSGPERRARLGSAACYGGFCMASAGGTAPCRASNLNGEQTTEARLTR